MKKQLNRENGSLAIAGFLTGVLLVCVGALTVYFLDDVKWMNARFKPLPLLTNIILIFFLSAVEELIFRKLVLRELSRRMNQWVALFISSILFAAIHLMNASITPIAIVNIFLGGTIFGLAYLYMRSLVFVIFFHFGWNFMQGPILGFKVSGVAIESIFKPEIIMNNTINGGTFGFEGSIICSALLFVCLLLFMSISKK